MQAAWPCMLVRVCIKPNIGTSSNAHAHLDGRHVQVKPGHVAILLQAHYGAHALLICQPALQR